MYKVKLSRLYVLCMVLVQTLSVEWCLPSDLSSYHSLCDSEYCHCKDPYGKVECTCQNLRTEQIIPEIIISSQGRCRIPEFSSAIYIENCQNVTFLQNSLKGIYNLRDVTVYNVQDVNIQSYGLHWNNTIPYDQHYTQGVTFNFTKVTIPDIPSYTFKGKVDKIIFNQTYIGIIRAFAFTSMSHLQSIEFQQSNIANLEAQSFKKLSINRFLINMTRLFIIPSRFIIELEIQEEFEIRLSIIETIKTLGIKAHGLKKLNILDTRINNIESEAFKIGMHGDVYIANCSFQNIEDYGLKGIHVEKHILETIGKQLFVFQNNTIGYFNDKSLEIASNFKFYFDRLLFDDMCTCDNLNKWIHRMIIFKDDPSIWCHPDDIKELSFEYIEGKIFYNENCEVSKSNFYFFILVIIVIVIGIIVLIVCIICFFKQRKKWKKVPTNSNDLQHQNNKLEPEIIRPEKGLMVPDGRTYKETEFQVVIERAEPLEPYLEHRTTIGKPVLSSDL